MIITLNSTSFSNKSYKFAPLVVISAVNALQVFKSDNLL